MEFLTALFLLFIFGAIFGSKKGKRRPRRRTSKRPSSARRPTPTKKSSLTEVETRLLEAIETGEILTVAYSAGTQPGSTRQIHPLKIRGDKVWAHCYSSNENKSFFVTKIKILPPETPLSYEDLTVDGSLETVETFKEKYIPQFRARGWTIAQSDEGLKLFDHFKNKKPRKTPALTLSYEPTYTEIDWLSEDQRTINHQRQKPWYVSTRDGSSQFSSLQRALTKFIMLERELSPFRE